jgi:hypothetical protein
MRRQGDSRGGRGSQTSILAWPAHDSGEPFSHVRGHAGPLFLKGSSNVDEREKRVPKRFMAKPPVTWLLRKYKFALNRPCDRTWPANHPTFSLSILTVPLHTSA